MDEEASFANLLSSTATPARPSWDAPAATEEHDPWANPFSTLPSTFVSPPPLTSTYSTDLASFTVPPSATLDSPRDEVSPYVQRLEQDRDEGVGKLPDPPSVIAAREAERGDGDAGVYASSAFATPAADPFGANPFEASSTDPAHAPFVPPPAESEPAPAPVAPPPSRKLPSTLIDEDLMAENDPELSLKKAFVKSSPAKPSNGTSTPTKEGMKKYVFTPKPEKAAKEDKAAETPHAESEVANGESVSVGVTAPSPGTTSEATPPPSSIPLPPSAAPTPIVSRTTTPAPKPDLADSQLATPSFDRVAVSPLDPPSGPSETDYGFKSLSIGGSAPLVPEKEARFGGRGWGAVDEDEGGLFGNGGPSVKADPWDASDAGDAGGWGEPGLDDTSAGPSRHSDVTPSRQTNTAPQDDTPTTPTTPTTPSRRSKLLSTPLFQISVGDPARVGDAVRGYTVYTVKTKTTSPHYRKGDFSVLRRFSDFLWLYEVLTANNPGVIVPPVPGKHTFGRFQDQFIETRRLALQRCLTKVTSHPVLQLDPDLRLFLESDNFAIEAKNRRQEVPAVTEKSLLGGWTGPRYIEQDDWFDSRRAFLDSLESQLKALSKSIEVASKARLDTAQSIHDFAETITALAESDLGTSLSTSLARLSALAQKEQETYEEQAKSDVVYLLNMADEYVRFIGSVRAAFAGRVKAWHSWQVIEKDVIRLKSHREKWRAQGKLGDRAASSLAEINETERRARDLANEYESLSKLIKSEFVRFERERVEEFKRVLEEYLDGMIARQKGLIDDWEEFHKSVLGIVQRQG